MYMIGHVQLFILYIQTTDHEELNNSDNVGEINNYIIYKQPDIHNYTYAKIHKHCIALIINQVKRVQ